MIISAIIIAVLQVFVINQLGFWGIGPILISVLVYLFRYEARLVELLTATAIYGFVNSLFLPAQDGLFQYLGLILATLVSVTSLRIILKSRYRIVARGIDTFFFAVIFSSIYWLFAGLNHIQNINPVVWISIVIGSIGLNLLIFMLADLGYKILGGRADGA